MPKRIIKKIINLLRFEKSVNNPSLFSEKEKKNLVEILSAYTGCPPHPLKLRIYELMLRLRAKFKSPFGLLIVAGWRDDFNDHAAIPDTNQNLFRGRHFDLLNNSFERSLEAIARTLHFDDAILVSRGGLVLASGVYLDNMRPKEVAEKLHLGRSEDLSQAFGFAKKVHARHLAAVSASYMLHGTTVFVLSEEDRSVRIFEQGKIIWSTNPQEAESIIKQKAQTT